jgi:choline dehydrogenase-like flavoprotein
MNDTFDYVVVGAGSAGCVLANRLTADGKTTLALVEAGGPDKKTEIHIPAAFSKLFKSPYDWAYFTEEQKNLDNRKLYWPRGKVLGGSSSINAMIYTRGHRHDFDEWHRLGNTGWSFDDLEPAFDRRLIEVNALRTTNPLSHAFLDACQQSGIPRTDFKGEANEGAGFFEVTQREGQRCSCAAGYLKPALDRANLEVHTHAQATRILFDGQRASGIEFVQNGKTRQLRAQREVILSGGAINSPQLLMLSGIGAADELSRAGVSVKWEMPGVGKNLQDHLVAGVVHQCTKPVSLGGAETLANLFRYLVWKKGMLTSNVAEAGAFVRMSSLAPAPDMEVIFGPVYYMNHGFSNPKGHGFTVGAILLHPKSRGSIRLRSNDPFAAPAIDPNYFADASDRKLLLDGVRLCRRIARAKAFDEFRGSEVWPGSPSDSDAEMEAFVRRTAETIYHPVGTCRMGSDDLSVVDSRLRVRGIDGLRVIDASVMPAIITGHPNAAVVAIAEKGAELIRGSA